MRVWRIGASVWAADIELRAWLLLDLLSAGGEHLCVPRMMPVRTRGGMWANFTEAACHWGHCTVTLGCTCELCACTGIGMQAQPLSQQPLTGFRSGLFAQRQRHQLLVAFAFASFPIPWQLQEQGSSAVSQQYINVCILIGLNPTGP